MSRRQTALPYTEPREIAGRLAGREVRVVTKPGFPGWDRVSGAQELLAEHADVSSAGSAYCFGCGHGALAAALWLRQPHLRLTLADPSIVALAMARRTLAANGVRGATVREELAPPPALAGAVDVVTVEAPGSRPLARRWLLEAHALLRPGGRLYIAGANDQGIQPLIGDAAALFGSAQQLGYGGRARVALAVKGEPCEPPAWAGEPGIAPGTWHELAVEVGGERLPLLSLPGVFSYNRLDDGTRLLLEAMPDVRGMRVLDAGCGYGVIGVVAARRGAAAVDMVDASLPAVAAARANVRLHRLEQASALASDALQAVIERRYDLVLTNPPFHAGKAVDYDVAHVFIEQARRVLGADGRLVLVANRFIRYERVIERFFARVRVLAQTRSFQVLEASGAR